jgi:hypothetical protein
MALDAHSLSLPPLGALVVAPILGLTAACGSSEPIVLYPKTPGIEATACPANQTERFELKSVSDKRGYADPNNVGFTQTGMYNVQASLRTETPAALVVRKALIDALRRCRLLGQGDRAQPIAVDLLSLQVTEVTSFTSETMTANVKYEVAILDGATQERLARFAASGESEHSGLDTTDYAEQSISEALAASLPKFVEGLAKAVKSAGRGSEGAITIGDEGQSPVKAKVRFLTPDEQSDRFGTTLGDKQILAVEISVQRLSSPAGRLRFRRQDFRLFYADGSHRFPLDPLKVRERHRIAVPTMVYAGGVVFSAGSIGGTGDTEGLDKAVEELTMREKTRSFKGVLFFDMEGIRHEPVRIEIAFEDVSTGAAQKLEVALPTP